MFLPHSQLESALLKRLANLQGLQSAPALGLAHCLLSVLQAHNSAACLEWSSTDGQDEGQQEHVQVDIGDAALAAQLGDWEAWLATGGVLAKPQYYTAAHAVVQDILSCIIVGGSEPPSVSRTALDAAWGEDAGSSSETLTAERFKNSLAVLASTCSSDGTAPTAAACLGSLLPKQRDQPQRWQGLLEKYTAGMQPAEAAEAQPPAAVLEPVGAEGGSGDATVAPDSAGSAAVNDSNDDLETLLGEDTLDVGPALDTSPPPAATQATPAPDADALAAASASGAGPGADSLVADEEDDTSSPGLSRAASQTSTAPSKGGGNPSPTRSPEPRAIAARALSTKSVEDPELRRALSNASSSNLDELPPDDLEALLERQGSNAKASSRLAKLPPSAAAAAGSGGGGGATESGKGHLADMDLRNWVALKDKQQLQQLAGNQQGRGTQIGGLGLVQVGRGDATTSALDQHLKSGRGPPGAAAPGNIQQGSAVRQSPERDRGGGQVTAGIARHGSHDSPSRQRSLAGNLSRKLSVSEPGPMGQQAEWKHLPALGHASRLHPPELRQVAYGLTRGPPVVSQSRGRGDTAAALVDDKLPALPALAGARGQPPKAMELMRRTSGGQRNDGHRADSRSSPSAHLPGLGQGQGGKPLGPPGPRALLCVQPSRKKSFGGDNYF